MLVILLLWLLATALLVYAAWRAAVALVRLALWLTVGVVRFLLWV